MKEIDYSIVPLTYDLNPEKVVAVIEKEVKEKWDKGWLFVKAEPDSLFESIRIYFERNVYV